MSHVDFGQRRIDGKLAYYGPAQSGKTASLRAIHARTRAPDAPPDPPPAGEGPHYDFLPLKLGDIRGFSTHFGLYTMPAGADAAAVDLRRRLLEAVDGVVFVADARPQARAANAASMRELEQHLASYGLDLAEIPLVVQLNKVDLLVDDEAPADLATWLPPALHDVEVVPSIAVEGEGVFDALKVVAKLVLSELKKMS